MRSTEAGGLSLETLAEDTDLTLSLHRHRQRIVYVPDAIAWTEAPETVRALTRQRSRWAYGTLQCLWKHRDMVFNWNYRALGWFSLPSIWFFQIILVAVTPMVDLFLLASLPIWRVERGVAVRHHIPGDGRDPRHARLHVGARTDRARLAHSADAPDLSSHAQLLHLESHPARHQRRLGQLGQTRAHRQRARASVIANLPCFASANAEMFAPNHVTHLIEQFRFVCSFATSMLKAGASHLCRSQKILGSRY